MSADGGHLLLILFAGTMVFWHGSFGGVDTRRQFTVLSAATTVFIVFPLYAYQLGTGRTTPLTAQIIRALGPVFVFALEQLDGRLQYSLPTLACILVYSASVIVSNIAHGWTTAKTANDCSVPVDQRTYNLGLQMKIPLPARFAAWC
jgi:hypothetical protein